MFDLHRRLAHGAAISADVASKNLILFVFMNDLVARGKSGTARRGRQGLRIENADREAVVAEVAPGHLLHLRGSHRLSFR